VSKPARGTASYSRRGARSDPEPFAVSLWTKDVPKKHRGLGLSPALRRDDLPKRGIAKPLVVAGVALVLVLVGGTVDWAMNRGKVYPGISVGEVDLGGKTAEEARDLMEAAFVPRLVDTRVLVFASEEASLDPEESLRITEEYFSDENIPPEEARPHRLVWQADAISLVATFDTEGLVADALACGRKDGGIIRRLQALAFGSRIEPRARYNQDAFDALAHDIDLTIGEPRVNFGIVVEEGTAYVSDGHDGHIVDRDDFRRALDSAFFLSEEEDPGFVAEAHYAPLQVTHEMAQEVCDKVNDAIGLGAYFTAENGVLDADKATLGTWVATDIEPSGRDWRLVPYLDYKLARETLLDKISADYGDQETRVRFVMERNMPIVKLDTPGTMPLTEEALKSLSAYIFAADTHVVSQPRVTVASVPLPSKMGFEEALDYGVIARIAEFTTEYTTYATERNHNIHLAATMLNHSIVERDGGIWSFNDTAGDCNEGAGFRGAGAIVDGEIVDEIGGGICQVATTVFNAVYDSGFPIVRRHNHTLYMPAYPEGRDAAVSWPDLDLRWKNDSPSDVLLVMSYTDSTVTAGLYGVDPGYQVTTLEGGWSEGEKFKTKRVVDETMAEGSYYIKTPGEDGSSVSIVRTVTDREGNLLLQDSFVSVYPPIDEVILVGPNTPAPGA